MSARFLSAEELVKLYRPVAVDKTLPTRGGQKDYAPDGSFLQAKRVESYHRERFELLREERVAKLGATAWGEWLPEVKKVEVKKENKFWQHLGHIEYTKKYLYPEEAAFLVDEGLLEIYYGGIPLSMQQVYGTVLGKHVPINHYHVYSHLSRLGYIMRRYIDVSHITSYERQIQLDKYVKDSDKKKKKRKRNKKEQDKDKMNNAQNEEVDTASKKTKYEESEEKNKNANCNMRGDGISCRNGNENLCIDSTDDSGHTSEFQSESTDVVCESNDQGACSGYEVDSINCDETDFREMEEEYVPVPHSNWDFKDISFPDFSKKAIKSDTVMTFPQRDKSVLPPGVELCNQISELNLSCFCSITKDDSQEFSCGHLSMKVKKSSAKNWTEYKQELGRISREDMLQDSPASVLWEEDDIKPLISPWEATCTADILQKLKIVPNVSLTTNGSKIPAELDLDIVYDVFLPNSNFKKTMPGLPNHRICIIKNNSSPPDLSHIVHTCRKCTDGVPLHWAVVDNGDIAFYCFNDVDIPIDITMG